MDIMSDEMHNADVYLLDTHVVRYFRISFVVVSVVILFLFPFLNWSYMLFCYAMTPDFSFVVGKC